VTGSRKLRDEFLVFGAPVIEEDEIDEVVATMRSGWLGTGLGTRVSRRIGPANYATTSCSA
jgi:hypothetical protein